MRESGAGARGIVAYGAYVPYWRLERAAIGAALGSPAGSGTRSVASYDEDTTSLAVEAGRVALRALGAGGGDEPATAVPDVLYFATTDPAYLDKCNATAIHAALDLSPSTMAVDMCGAVRSAAGALRAAMDARAPAMAVLADVRGGLPGGADEREGGDGAVAFICAGQTPARPVLAQALASASMTAEFLDRWRRPGEIASRQWEERFGEHAYVPLGQAALTEALARAGVAARSIDRLIVAGPHGRANRRVAAAAGVPKEALADDLTGAIGNAGAAHAGLLLADALDRTRPGQVIAVVSLADGADATVWRTTDALASRPPARTVADQVTGATGRVGYATFLTWRGLLRREPPRRPDPKPPEAPPARRSEDWKFAFTGSRCQACGTRHLPPQRVCVRCHAVDRMERERLADVPGTIATFTVDRLAYSPSPPVVVGVIDFDGGGRFQCELTDVDPAAVKIGHRVGMTFRRLITADGVHNYFWKARPLRPA